MIEVTGRPDLSRFAAAYRADGQGQAPYDLAMMTALQAGRDDSRAQAVMAT